MNRSKFFKTTIAAVAAFFGFKKAPANDRVILTLNSNGNTFINGVKYDKPLPYDTGFTIHFNGPTNKESDFEIIEHKGRLIRDFKRGKDAIDSFMS